MTPWPAAALAHSQAQPGPARESLRPRLSAGPWTPQAPALQAPGRLRVGPVAPGSSVLGTFPDPLPLCQPHGKKPPHLVAPALASAQDGHFREPGRPPPAQAPVASLRLGLGHPPGSGSGAGQSPGLLPRVLRGSVGEARGGPVSPGASVGGRSCSEAADRGSLTLRDETKLRDVPAFDGTSHTFLRRARPSLPSQSRRPLQGHAGSAEAGPRLRCRPRGIFVVKAQEGCALGGSTGREGCPAPSPEEEERTAAAGGVPVPTRPASLLPPPRSYTQAGTGWCSGPRGRGL